MELIFAKWVLAFALPLMMGKAQDFPFMETQRVAPGHIEVNNAIAVGPWDPSMIKPPVVTKRQQFCMVSPGVYTVNLRLGFLPLAEGQYSSGQIVFEGPQRTVALDFEALPGWHTRYATSFAVLVEQPTCYHLSYTATGYAELNPDPAVTSLTIHR